MPFIEHSGKRILFIHIPKTGGTSIEAWLRGISPLALHSTGAPNSSRVTPQHLSAGDLAYYFPPDWFHYTFTVVRNPFDRLESEYRMRYLLHVAERDRPFLPFGTWVKRTLASAANDHYVLDNHIRPQVQFLGRGVQIFRFEETIPRIIRRVSKATGLPQPESVAHEMSSSGFDGDISWREEEVALVRRFYARDFERLGYSTSPKAYPGP